VRFKLGREVGILEAGEPSFVREYGIYLCQNGKAAIWTPAPPGTEFGWSFRGLPY
jgi:hypothetical protein